jgi:FAD:protein FMN transferase
MKKILTILLLNILILTGCTPSTSDGLNRYDQSTFDAGFDTVIRFIAYTENRADFDRYFNQLKEDFLFLNSLFDKYNEYENVNNIYTINKMAGISPVEVDPLIIDLILMSQHWYDEGEQLLDITLGAVLNIWHDYRDLGLQRNSEGLGGAVPSIQILQEADTCTGWDFVEIDQEKNTVFITDACASIDVGATAKGYAAEYVARRLEQAGLEHAIISAGGNVRSINTRPGNESWAVGVELPEMFSERSADTLRIPQSVSIVTSGDYQRFYLGDDGNYYHHLINPNTLFPESYFHSVTAVTKDSGIADALSTILFLMTYEEGVNYITQLQLKYPNELIGAFWIFHKEGELPTQANLVESEGYQVAITDSLIPYSRIFNP